MRVPRSRVANIELHGGEVLVRLSSPDEVVQIAAGEMSGFDRNAGVQVLREALDLEDTVPSGLRFDETNGKLTIQLVREPSLLSFSSSSYTNVEITGSRVSFDNHSFAAGRIEHIDVDGDDIVFHLLDPHEDIRLPASAVSVSDRWHAVKQLRGATTPDDLALKREVLQGSKNLANRGKQTTTG